jgi:hypothetical protein
MNPLALRLWALLSQCSDALGPHEDPGSEDEFDYHPVGKEGVVAFNREGYMLCAWPEGPGARSCMVQALQLLGQKLEGGPVRCMVYWRNFRCVKIVRKAGFRPLGTDKDGYFYYELTRERFRYGQRSIS